MSVNVVEVVVGAAVALELTLPGTQGPQGIPGAASTVPGPTGPVGPTGATGLTGPTGPSAYQVVRGSNTWRQRLFSQKPMLSMPSNFTYQTLWRVPEKGKSVLVRAGFWNDSSSAYTVNAVAVASGSAFADQNPMLVDGVTPAPWTVNSTPFSIPAAGAGVATDGSIAQAFSPWTRVDVSQRRDGSDSHGLIFLRTINATGAVGPISGLFVGLAALGLYRVSYQSGDRVTASQTTFAPGGNSDGSYMPCFLEVMSADRAISVAVCGDSTRSGSGTTAACYNATFRACNALSTPALPVCSVNWAQGGATYIWFHGQATTRISSDIDLPDVLFIQPCSENGLGYDLANAQASWASTLQLVALCHKKGVKPILTTCQPTTAITTAPREANRLWINANVRASNSPYIDYDAVLSDNGTPYARLLAGTTADGIHPNDSGEALIVPYVTAVLTTLIGA